MKKTILAATLSLVGSLYSQAQSVVTDPVGFVSVTVPAQSDAALGAPLGRANEYQGVIQSISGSVITVAGTPGWLASQFVYVAGTQPKTYYARIDSGVREGLIGAITANDATSITITVPSGEVDLSGVLTNAVNATGDTISIAPYWTLGTLITGVPAGTVVLTYSPLDVGFNLSSSATYVYSGSAWLKGITPSDDVTLPPLQGFVLRNNATNPIVVSITGSVPMATHRLVVRMNGSSKQDQRIFFNSPVPELVGNTGLGVTAGDQLLIIDNSLTGFNKASSATLTWTGSAWLKGVVDVTQSYQLQPGASFILRKVQAASTGTVVTSHLQSYLQ